MLSTTLQLALLFLLLSSSAHAQIMAITRPQSLKQSMKNYKFSVHASPLGYKPLSGFLPGNARIASPQSACDKVDKIEEDENENVFLFADDTKCLESVKAKNLAEAGAYVGVIKRNINNTLHDKETNLTHIPILQVDPQIYNNITKFVKQNPNETVSMIANFTNERKHRINLDFWMTPTERQSYNFINKMKQFIENQPREINFQPRFVLHSQISKDRYVGCYSSGRYCPVESEFEGDKQGVKIVGQSLRQIIIAQESVSNWFKYATLFNSKCLAMDNLWQANHVDLCSENVMGMAGISYQDVMKKFQQSFQGDQPVIDPNIILEEERQLYVYEQITKYPSILINKNQQTKLDPIYIQKKICYKMHPQPTKQSSECQKLTNPGTFSWGQIFIILGVVIVVLVLIMVGYRFFVHYRMRKEMKGQVDKTLQQYYRYMETFEEDDPSVPKALVAKEEKEVETNQIGSVELAELPPPPQPPQQA